MTPSQAGQDSTLARAVIGVTSLLVPAAVVVVIYLVPTSAAVNAPAKLATVNALLNGGAGVFLLLGVRCVRRGNLRWHKRFMLSAFTLSSVFLVTYLVHHAQVGSVRFRGEGLLRDVYLATLIPHIVLAALIVPLALFTIYRGLSGRTAAHRRIARWTFPIWLYVSVSGVLVYLMLYHL